MLPDADPRLLGTCPVCEEAIPPDRLLARYAPEEGWPRLFAECPDCEIVRHPV